MSVNVKLIDGTWYEVPGDDMRASVQNSGCLQVYSAVGSQATVRTFGIGSWITYDIEEGE